MLEPDVRRYMRVRLTDWGDAVRIDLNQLGARLPAQGAPGATWSETTGESLRDEWAEVSERGALRHDGGRRRLFRRGLRFVRRVDRAAQQAVRRRPYARIAAGAVPPGLPGSDHDARLGASGNSPFHFHSGRGVRAEDRCRFQTVRVAARVAIRYRIHGARARRGDGLRRRPADPSVGALSRGTSESIRSSKASRNARFPMYSTSIQDVFSEGGGSLGDVVRLRPFAHSSEIARIIRAEVSRRWAGPSEARGDDVGQPADSAIRPVCTRKYRSWA